MGTLYGMVADTRTVIQPKFFLRNKTNNQIETQGNKKKMENKDVGSRRNV